MSRGSKILAGTLAALYVAFVAWYGGRGRPLTPAEIDGRLADIAARARNDAAPGGRMREELQHLLANDDGNEFFMLNLIRFREKAQYPAGYRYGDDALEADARYNKAIVPYLLKHGGVPVLLGEPEGRFIDEAGDTEWQRVALVRYRSRRDLLEMIADLAGQDVGVHKWASIEKTQVFPIRLAFSFVFVRGAVAALFALVGVLLHLLLRRAAWYRGRPIQGV